MNLLNVSAALPALDMYLTEITERQIERDGGKIDKPSKNDRPLGPLTSDLAKRLYCACNIIKAKSIEAAARAKIAIEDHEEKALLAEAKQLDQLADLAREFLWYEVRSSADHWNGGIGIRHGWVVVEPPENDNQPPEFIKRLLNLGE